MEQLIEKIFSGKDSGISFGKETLYEDFDMPEINPNLKWMNPPEDFSHEYNFSCLAVRPEKGTEFWKTISKKYSCDSGHFLFTDIAGDFILKSKIRMKPFHKYDQGGLMVRVSETCWIKAGYEHETVGSSGLMVTVANGKYSDWSRSEMNDYKDFVLKITREGNLYTVEYLVEKDCWVIVRMAHLDGDDMESPVKCGIYAACPEEKGMSVSFDYLGITRIR